MAEKDGTGGGKEAKIHGRCSLIELHAIEIYQPNGVHPEQRVKSKHVSNNARGDGSRYLVKKRILWAEATITRQDKASPTTSNCLDSGEV